MMPSENLKLSKILTQSIRTKCCKWGENFESINLIQIYVETKEKKATDPQDRKYLRFLDRVSQIFPPSNKRRWSSSTIVSFDDHVLKILKY